MGSTALTVMSAFGVAGNLPGGILAGRLELNRIIFGGFCFFIALLPLSLPGPGKS